MTKRQLIDSIMRINQSARPDFLSNFSERELLEYLQHLQAVMDRRPIWRVCQPAMAV
jgi:hypothetical protein